MWVMVLFDLPTNTRAERKAASDFRQKLMKDGFGMFQFSIYIRHCHSRENAEVHKQRVRRALPRKGKVAVFHITDKQFSMIEMFQGKANIEPEKPMRQLELF